MTSTVISTILSSGVTLMIPVLWAGLGELVEETAGIINVGIEGVMLTGAYATAQITQTSANEFLGFMAGLGAGLACGVLLAYIYVYRAVDQLITGLMFTLLAIGLTTVLYQANPAGTTFAVFRTYGIPGLDHIPVVGAIFRQTILAYLAIASAALIWFLLRHTWFGLYVRAVGQGPSTAATSGVNAHRIRFVSVVIGCTLIGVGGATLVLTESGSFIADITSDQGFIALAMVMLAGWNPIVLIAAVFLFGVSDSLQYAVQTIRGLAAVPHDVWLSIPYVTTIFVLAATRAREVPRALGVPLPPPGRRVGGGIRQLARPSTSEGGNR